MRITMGRIVTGIVISVFLFSCAVSYTGLKFSSPNDNSPKENYILTKNGQRHRFSGIKERSLIRKNYFVISESEKYPSSDVVAYRVEGNEYRSVEGNTAKKIVTGRINVFLYSNPYSVPDEHGRTHVTNKYYVQKGETNEPVMLIPQNAKKEIYTMLSDFRPSKEIMDEYIKSSKQVSMTKVVNAINAYNNR